MAEPSRRTRLILVIGVIVLVLVLLRWLFLSWG